MSENKQRPEAGWKVVGSLGKFIGTVEHVREDYLIVAQGRIIKHTLYIPVDHVASAANGTVALTLPATEADAQGWRFAPNAGFTHGEADFWDSPVAASAKARSTTGFGTSDMHGSMYDGKVDPEQMEDRVHRGRPARFQDSARRKGLATQLAVDAGRKKSFALRADGRHLL